MNKFDKILKDIYGWMLYLIMVSSVIAPIVGTYYGITRDMGELYYATLLVAPYLDFIAFKGAVQLMTEVAKQEKQ